MPASWSANLIDQLQEAQLLTPSQRDEARTLKQCLNSPRELGREMIRRGWLTPFQAHYAFSGRAKDLILGRYLILNRIGKGGFGQIYKARHLNMGRIVALKVLRPDLIKDQDAVQRFYREIEVVSQLSHPNIVHAYEAGPIDSNLVLVMEFVEGHDLEQLVEQSGPLPFAQASDYVRQTAVGLEYARQQGLIHRDIKPSNLLVTQADGSGSGMIKILDLGLARLQQPIKGSTTSHLTVLGSNTVMQGSPDYMSPEQALDFHSADIRSDIYSLGCTFYFLLAGQPPFAGGMLAQKLMKHQQVEPPLDRLTGVPDECRGVLARMLAKRSPDRQQTPAEVVEALRPFGVPASQQSTLPDTSLSSPTVNASITGLKMARGAVGTMLQRFWQWIRARPRLALASVLPVLAVLVFFMFFSGSPNEPGPPPPKEPQKTKALVESKGMVVVEAEHYTSKSPGQDRAAKHEWAKTTKLAGASGGVSLQASPNTGIGVGDSTRGPRCDYAIYFAMPGTYRIWVRMLGASGTDDSLHAGLDGLPASYGRLGLSSSGNRWRWLDNVSGRKVSVNVTTPGLHHLNIWMREDGVAIDKILLTTDTKFRPSGTGPAESKMALFAPDDSAIPRK